MIDIYIYCIFKISERPFFLFTTKTRYRFEEVLTYLFIVTYKMLLLIILTYFNIIFLCSQKKIICFNREVFFIIISTLTHFYTVYNCNTPFLFFILM